MCLRGLLARTPPYILAHRPPPLQAVCNDGTPGYYYLRRGYGSEWLVYLEGGLWCYDQPSCAQARVIECNTEWCTTFSSGALGPSVPGM
jgi:hypothetical protein